MRNSAHKKHEHHGHKQTTEQAEASDVVEFVTRSRLIAKQADEACHIEGNNNSPDFDEFEAKYGFSSFA